MAVLQILLSLVAAFAVGTDSLSVPLHQGQGDVSRNQLVARAVHRNLQERSTGLESVIRDTAGFWYGSVDVGDSKGLSLVLDTASLYVVANTGLYQPSAASIDLNDTYTFGLASTESNGCGIGNISTRVFKDDVTFAGLTAKNLTLFDVVPKPAPEPGTITQAQEQGLMGLGMNKLSFFPTLCAQGVVDECRYELAFGLDGTGTAILGSKDQGLYEGELSVQKTGQDWDMTNKLMVDGTEILAESDTVVLDSGTVNVIVPTAVARKLFTALGIQIVEQTLPGCTNSIFGYYPCDKPPTVGFQFGDKVFNIESSRFQLEDNGNNNCTAIITGIDVTKKIPNLWLIGQAWMQGKYVDFRKKDDGYEIGVADLKNPGSGCP